MKIHIAAVFAFLVVLVTGCGVPPQVKSPAAEPKPVQTNTSASTGPDFTLAVAETQITLVTPNGAQRIEFTGAPNSEFFGNFTVTWVSLDGELSADHIPVAGTVMPGVVSTFTILACTSTATVNCFEPSKAGRHVMRLTMTGDGVSHSQDITVNVVAAVQQ